MCLGFFSSLYSAYCNSEPEDGTVWDGISADYVPFSKKSLPVGLECFSWLIRSVSLLEICSRIYHYFPIYRIKISGASQSP